MFFTLCTNTVVKKILLKNINVGSIHQVTVIQSIQTLCRTFIELMLYFLE